MGTPRRLTPSRNQAITWYAWNAPMRWARRPPLICMCGWDADVEAFRWFVVEQVPGWVHQKTGLVVAVQRTQSHEPPAGNAPGGVFMLPLQIVQQRNLLFECGHGRPDHGEIASRSRLRPAAGQSQARMVGARRKVRKPGQQGEMAFTLQHRLSS